MADCSDATQSPSSDSDFVLGSGMHMDNAHRRRSRDDKEGNNFDIDELIRRLEAHRLELKLAQVRERSKALQNNGQGTLTYKPRYSVNLKTADTTQLQTPAEYRADRSRRTTRTFTTLERTSTRDSSQGSPQRDSRKSRRTTRIFDFDRSSADTPPSPPQKSEDRRRRRTTRIFEDDELPHVPQRSQHRVSRVFADAPAVSSEDFDPEPPVPVANKRHSILDMARPHTPEPPQRARQEPEHRQPFVNPKQLLAARNQGMSESEAIAHLTRDSQMYGGPPTTAEGLHARSYKFLNAPHAESEKKNARRKSRLASTFDSVSLGDLRGLSSSRTNSPRLGHEEQHTSNRPTSRDGLISKRKSWLRPIEDDRAYARPNWAQQSESCNADQRDRQRFLGRMKRASRVFAGEPAAPARPKSAAGEGKRHTIGSPGRESADSAIAMADGTRTKTGPKTPAAQPEVKKTSGMRRIIAALFGRR